MRFVADDYTGFDGESSKARSRRWMALNEIDFRRIGKRNIWTKNIVAQLMCPVQ
jgi:hypothetical protein